MILEIDYFSGAGNLFTAIDNKNYKLSKDIFSKYAPILTQKNNITIEKTEGIIVINESKDYDFEVWFFNPDGSSGMMCGNGGRCAISYAYEKNYIKNKNSNQVRFLMNGNVYFGEFYNNLIGIYFLPPFTVSEYIEIEIDGHKTIGKYVNVGTDHFVINVEDVSKIDVFNIGKKVREHSKFVPNGVNANFYSIDTKNKLRIRTYERGVEAETGACGTGAISTALVYSGITGVDNIELLPTSKNQLQVKINKKNNIIQNIVLIGNAVNLGSSNIKLDI
ncbi:MAG: diaminopimelate epimerase [Bacteroidetes bacterium]|nr:diaminopimelate epimerase [Bacteroidota bacterium]